MARYRIRHVPIKEFFGTYKPIEDVDWHHARKYFEEDHPVLMESLRDDISQHGIKTPIDVSTDDEVLNGHHRALAAGDVGLTHVPVIVREPGWRVSEKVYWDPETRRHYGPDEDEYDEGQLRY